MKKFFAGLLFICLFAGVSSADVVYNTSTGNLGVIEVSSIPDVSIPVTTYTNAGNDSILASFANGDYARILLIKRETDTSAISGDSALIFNTSDMTTPIDEYYLDGSYGAFNVGYSRNGNSVFVASVLDNTISEFDSGNFKYLNHYTLTDPDYLIRDLIVDNDYIYLLINASLTRSFLIRFDGQLKENVKTYTSFDIPFMADCVASLGNNKIVIGYEKGVARLDNRTFITLVSTDEEVRAVGRDHNTGNDGFYYITQIESNGNYTSSLWHYDSTIYVMLESETSSESACQLVYDKDKNVMAALMGGKIFVYESKTDTLLGEFDSADLDGVPLSITMSTVIKSSSKKNSSGCNLTGAGVVLMLIAALKFRRSKS